MKKFFVALVTFAFAVTSTIAAGTERGTPAEAEALVKKAIVHYKKVGREKAMADLSRKDGGFIDRDMYVTVFDFDGLSLAHINPRFLGKNMLDLRDTNGKYHIKERIELARKQGHGWQDIAGRINPVTKAMEDKSSYFESYDNLVFAVGAYKPN